MSDNEIGGGLFGRILVSGPILVSVGPGLYVMTLGGLTLAAAAAYLAVTARSRRRDDVIVGGAGDDTLNGADTGTRGETVARCES